MNLDDFSADYLSISQNKILKIFPDALHKVSILEEVQGHVYKNKLLPLVALFHRSALVFWPTNKDGLQTNEKLEFLGDAFLGFFVATEAMKIHKNFSEAELSQLRAFVAGTENLAMCFTKLGLSDALMTGTVELFKPTGEPNSFLADAFEAISAALLIDGGFEKASRWLGNVLHMSFVEFSEREYKKDYKSKFQEWLQKFINVQPEYRVLCVQDDAAASIVEVGVFIVGKELMRASAGNKKLASQIAAKKLIEKIDKKMLNQEKIKKLVEN